MLAILDYSEAKLLEKIFSNFGPAATLSGFITTDPYLS